MTPAVVYIDPRFVRPFPGVDPDEAKPATVFGWDAFLSLQEVVNQAGGNGTVSVGAGIYDAGAFGAETVTLIVGADNGDVLIRGVLGGQLEIVKVGGGSLTLTGDNTFAGGVVVQDGSFIAANDSGSATGTGAVTFQSGTTLGGDGAVGGPLSLAGSVVIDPGPGAASLSVGNLLLDGGSLYLADLLADGNDRLDVDGLVGFADGVGLILSGTFTPAIGQSFTILDNRGTEPVSGTFQDLPEGARLFHAGRLLEISYVGGDGNDIVLTALASDTTAPTVTSILPQSANPASGDAVQFRVTFSEEVAGVTAADFVLSGTAATGARIGVPVPAIGAGVYDVPITGLAENSGTLSLAFAALQNITDLSGNVLSDTTPGTSESFIVDNAPLTISPISDRTQLEDTASGPIPFTVSEGLTPPEQLLVTVASSNPALVDPASIHVTGNGAERTLEFTPQPNAVGQTTITVTVADSDGQTADTAFVVTVNAVPFPWQNPRHRMDVNNDGTISPQDVLVVMNEINAHGSRDLANPVGSAYSTSSFYDVNGDNRISPLDVLLVVNDLNAFGARPVPAASNNAAAGEGEAPLPTSAAHLPFAEGFTRPPVAVGQPELPAPAPAPAPAAATIDRVFTPSAMEQAEEATSWRDELFDELPLGSTTDRTRLVDAVFDDWSPDL